MKQRMRLRELLYWDLKTVSRRAPGWQVKESLQALWEYKSPTHAGRFLDEWCRSAMRSKLEPVKRVAKCYSAGMRERASVDVPNGAGDGLRFTGFARSGRQVDVPNGAGDGLRFTG